MPEIQKYNLKEELKRADELYKDSTALVGMSSLTEPRYINSTRTQMFTSHLKQFLNLVEPQFPRVFTNAENTVGKHSSAYLKTKSDLEIIEKIEKYGDILETPYIYHLFVFDKKKKKYKVITRKEVEENLTEDFGFHYNNDEIDRFKVGDIIPKGDVLYKSNSYDESMNYRYGTNAKVQYVLNPYTSEDAADISESFSKRMTSMKVKKIPWGLNKNDIPLNLYGDEDEYKPYPDIGEPAAGIFGCARPQYNNQLLFDFKDSNLRIIKDSDRPVSYAGHGFIVDYEIYCNDDELEETSFNSQIIKYLNSQTKYWKKIYKVTKKIINSGYDYDKDIDYLHKRADEYLDTDKKWKDDSVFGGVKIVATIAEYLPLTKGNKFSGRYGNKSVVSRVVPDDQMPHTENGEVVDVRLNLLAIINRTTGFVPHELFITFICRRAREQMLKAKTLKEKEDILFSVIKDLNEKQYKSMYAYYKDLKDTKLQEEYINDCIYDGIYIHQNPVYEDEPILYKLQRMTKKYSWLEPYQLYINIDGHEIPQIQKTYLGEMYMIRLKQTDKKNFSARNTGSINTKELPERSYKNRNHQDLFSDKAIRFGEYETLALMTGLSEDELALFHAYYRTSVKGRRDVISHIFEPDRKLSEIDSSLTNRVAELFNVIFKSLSFELEFLDEDDVVRSMDNKDLQEYTYKGQTYFMTEYQFYLFKLEDELRSKILEETPGLTDEELSERIKEELISTKHVIGVKDAIRKDDKK